MMTATAAGFGIDKKIELVGGGGEEEVEGVDDEREGEEGEEEGDEWRDQWCKRCDVGRCKTGNAHCRGLVKSGCVQWAIWIHGLTAEEREGEGESIWDQP